MTATPPQSPPPVGRAKKLSWIGLLYAGEGTPFGVVTEVVPLWLRSFGVNLETIGLFAGLEAPWSWKFLWAPLVDIFLTKRRWIAIALFGAAAALAAAATVGVSLLTFLALLLTGFTLFAATADIAIDAYTIGLVEKGEEGPANSTRVATYRAATLAVGSPITILAGIAGWTSALWLIAGLLATIGALALLAPSTPDERRIRAARPIGEEWIAAWHGFKEWSTRDGALVVALLALLYKQPDAAMGPMVRTFWQDSGLSLEQIGAWITPIGLASVVIGSIVGGLIVARIGILRGLFWLGILQAASNVSYALAAWQHVGLVGIAVAAAIEQFTGGLGTAAFIAFMMRVCEKERAATEYALLSALFALTRFPAKLLSGFGVEWIGYGGWFALTALTAIPGLALLFSKKLAERVGEERLRRLLTVKNR